MDEPPLEQWAREHALREVYRIAQELPHGIFEETIKPRLARLTKGQRAILEAGLLVLEAREASPEDSGIARSRCSPRIRSHTGSSPGSCTPWP
jgi:hypothetical protein